MLRLQLQDLLDSTGADIALRGIVQVLVSSHYRRCEAILHLDGKRVNQALRANLFGLMLCSLWVER